MWIHSTASRGLARRTLLGGALGLVGSGFCRASEPAKAAAAELGDLELDALVASVRALARGWREAPNAADGRFEERYLAALASLLTRLGEVELPGLELAPGSDPFDFASLVYYPPISIFAIAMAPGARFDLHDHRRANGGLCLRSGSLECRHYEFVDPAAAAESGAQAPAAGFDLRRTSTLALRSGQTATLGTERDNLHELVAGPEGAVLIDAFCFLGPELRSREVELLDPSVALPGEIRRARWKT